MLIFCTNKVLTAIKRPDTIVVAIPPTNGLVRSLIFFDCYCFGFPVWVRYWFFIPRCTTRLYVTDGGVNIARSFSGYQMYPPIRGFRTNIAHSHLGSYVFYLVLITVHIAKSHFTTKNCHIVNMQCHSVVDCIDDTGLKECKDILENVKCLNCHKTGFVKQQPSA